MKIWTSEHTFVHPWETVVKAAQKKYPNPHNPSVIGIDVVDRTVDSKGVLKSHRLLTTAWNLPHWVIKMIGMKDFCHVSEHSEIDPRQKSLLLRSCNLDFCNFVTINEKLVYTPHPQQRNCTLLKQEATICVNGVPLSSHLEGMIEKSMAGNANKGRQGMEYVIDKVKEEVQSTLLSPNMNAL